MDYQSEAFEVAQHDSCRLPSGSEARFAQCAGLFVFVGRPVWLLQNAWLS